jgi:hypothetical protein
MAAHALRRTLALDLVRHPWSLEQLLQLVERRGTQ